MRILHQDVRLLFRDSDMTTYCPLENPGAEA